MTAISPKKALVVEGDLDCEDETNAKDSPPEYRGRLIPALAKNVAV